MMGKRQRYQADTIRFSGEVSAQSTASHPDQTMPFKKRTRRRPFPAASKVEAGKARRFSDLGLAVILVVFLLLTTLHSVIVPITQGEDELAHYRYISFIAQTGRLPLNFAEREQAWYRADWPPLYHLLVGWLVSPIDTTRPPLKDVGESPRRRLVGEIFYPRLIIYTEDANWPWQDGILAWHIGRFTSILFSAGALIFTYLTVLELAGHASTLAPKLIALATTALLAFIPRYLFTSAMLGDDSLFILLSAVFIWLLLRALRGDDRWWVYGVLGLILGLSIATKYSTGLLPLVIIPVAWWRAKRMSWRWPQWAGRVAVCWLGTLIGASWWFGWIGYHFNTIKEDGLFFGLLRPLLASGPDVSMRRIFALFSGGQFTGQERPAAIEAGTFWSWLVYLFHTFWGVPVLEHDPLFPWAYLLVLIFCVLALIGLWQFWRTANNEMRVTLIVLGLIIALLLPFPILRFFLTKNILETGQGRHLLYPAAQAIPLLLMLGWITLPASRSPLPVPPFRGSAPPFRGSAPPFRGSAPRSLLFAFLPAVILLIWSIFQLGYIAAVYPDPLPVRTTTFEAASIPQPLKHNFGDDIQLLGYDFAPDPDLAIINLTLFWRALNPVSENYRVQVQLVDPNGQTHFTWLSHPLNGRYPTRAWDQGDVIRDKLPLPLAAVPPNPYTIQINLLHEAEATALSEEPFTIIQFQLPAAQPIVNASTLADFEYRLWVNDTPARYRQTLSLSRTGQPSPPAETASRSELTTGSPNDRPVTWTLIGPDQIPRLPVAAGDATDIFIVGADWPSGDYHLQLQAGPDSYQTDPLLTVANEARRFDLPAQVVTDPNWTPVDAIFAGSEGQPQVKLLGYILPSRRVEPGAGLPLTLYWQSLAPVLGDYVVFDVLLDENQQPFGGYDRLPREYYSTILWAEGEVVEDGFAVPVSAEAPSGIYHLHIGLYSLVDGSPHSLPLMAGDQPGEATSVVIGPLKVGGPPPGATTEAPRPQVSLNQSFNGQVTLLGYDLTDETGQPVSRLASPLSTLKFTLYWRAETTLDTGYTTFLHLRDAANETVAQKDRPPVNGRYPTTLWDPGEIIVDEITLSLDQVPPGVYTPVIGLYDRANDTRLPIAGHPNNELPLESVTLP